MLRDLPETLIVVPCFDEARRLRPDAFGAHLAERPHLRFLFVDDGSRDDTPRLLDAFCARHAPRAALLRLPANGGKGAAVRAGVRAGLARGAPAWVGYWDADLATPLAEIDRFLAEAVARPSVRLILGARVARLGARVRRRAVRHYLGRAFATAASLVLRLPVYDTQCGAKLVRADLAARLFAEPFRTRWLFDVELLQRAVAVLGEAAAPDALLEVPLEAWEETGGSKLPLRAWLAAPFELARLRRR